MVEELTSWGWKTFKREEIEIDKEMDFEDVFDLVDINNSGFITKTVNKLGLSCAKLRRSWG